MTSCAKMASYAILALSMVAFGATPAHAGWITFDYNTVSLSGTNLNANVQNYMNGVLTPYGMSVTVTGANASNSYTGDGHVVGPSIGGVVKPLTLGTTDGGNPTTPNATNDIFIDTEASTEIDLTFTKKVYSVNFDFEIFPNGSCPSLPCGTSTPDFGFWADGTQVYYVQATTPVAPNNKSPLSPNGGELAPQLAPTNVTFNFQNGVSALRFVDWPVTIGIDNLKVNTTAPVVPEPATLVLLGSGLAAAYAKRRRQRQGTAPDVTQA